ncbi:amino acid permease [bacterium]|nr:amino acid permease [bacterium]
MSRQSKIGFWAAVLMNINIIVGAGILAMTQSMAATAGAASFLAWPMIGLLVFPVVWCIAQASRVFPGEGGIYNYCAKGINPTAGFVAQWAYLLGYMGTATTLTLVLKDALVHKAGLTIVGEYSMLFNTAVIVVFTLLNMLDVSKISKIQSGLTLLKLLPLVVVSADEQVISLFLASVYRLLMLPSVTPKMLLLQSDSHHGC